jgi:hypothetical protein
MIDESTVETLKGMLSEARVKVLQASEGDLFIFQVEEATSLDIEILRDHLDWALKGGDSSLICNMPVQVSVVPRDLADAIQHQLDKAEGSREEKCKEEHLQLAHWLMELQELRGITGQGQDDA